MILFISPRSCFALHWYLGEAILFRTLWNSKLFLTSPLLPWDHYEHEQCATFRCVSTSILYKLSHNSLTHSLTNGQLALLKISPTSWSWEQFDNNLKTIWHQFENNLTTTYQIFVNNLRTLCQKYDQQFTNNRLTIPVNLLTVFLTSCQQYANNLSTICKQYANIFPMMYQQFSNNLQTMSFTTSPHIAKLSQSQPANLQLGWAEIALISSNTPTPDPPNHLNAVRSTDYSFLLQP